MNVPDREEELNLAERMLGEEAPESVLSRGSVETVVDENNLPRLRAALNEVLVKPELLTYLVDIIRETRKHDSVLVGAGPRATQALLLASRAHAALNGRDFVTPDDVRVLVQPILEHRVMLRPEFEIEGTEIVTIVRQILEKIPVPR
jgi:MoxR-like ATPase